jgi:hypothetical protein
MLNILDVVLVRSRKNLVILREIKSRYQYQENRQNERHKKSPELSN